MKYTYIDEYAIKLELRNNRPVQHWQSWREYDGFRIIKWIEVDPTRNGKYAIFEHESLDCGSEEFIDMGEFGTAGDPDEPEGRRTEFESIDFVINYLQTIGAI